MAQTMIVGKLLERAQKNLKSQWQTGVEQGSNEPATHEAIPWMTFLRSGLFMGINLDDEVDINKKCKIKKKIYANYEVGKVIDERIMKGQIDGVSLAQGLAYGYLEKMTSKQGKIQQKNITDYGPPTSMDVVSHRKQNVC